MRLGGWTSAEEKASLFAWSWTCWTDFNRSERLQATLIALAVVALVLFSQWMK